ncbi:hypothetical protein ACFL35_12745 [Candidatus Riflebacteria bacterium]
MKDLIPVIARFLVRFLFLLPITSQAFAGPYTIQNRGVKFFRHAIRSIAMDKKGTLYYGTYGSGMGVLSRKGFRVWNSQNSFVPEDRVNSLFYDKNDDLLLLGTCGGIAIYDLKTRKAKILTEKDGLAENITHTILRHKKTVFIGTTEKGLDTWTVEKGFCTFTSQNTNNGLLSDWINGNVFDTSGRMWVGTAEGLVYYDKKSGWGHLSREDGLRSDFVSQIDIWEDDLWIATFDSGLARYKIKSKTIDIFDINSGLPANEVFFIDAFSPGKAWVATLRGISEISGGQVQSYTKKHGLFDPWIKCVLKSSAGVFAGSSKGILYKKVKNRFEPLIIQMKTHPKFRYHFLKNFSTDNN